MDDRRDILIALGWRLLVASALAAAGWHLSAPTNSEYRFLGLACVVAAAIVIAPPLAALVAEPTGSIFFPRHPARCEPAYSRANATRLQGRYEDAIAAYQSIADEFPDELRAHVAMMEITLIDVGDTERADAIVKRALAALCGEASRHELLRRRSAIKAKLANAAPKPATGSETSGSEC